MRSATTWGTSEADVVPSHQARGSRNPTHQIQMSGVIGKENTLEHPRLPGVLKFKSADDHALGGQPLSRRCEVGNDLASTCGPSADLEARYGEGVLVEDGPSGRLGEDFSGNEGSADDDRIEAVAHSSTWLERQKVPLAGQA